MFEAGQRVRIRPYNKLLTGPGSRAKQMGVIVAEVETEVVEVQGDWVRVCCMAWMHQSGVRLLEEGAKDGR